MERARSNRLTELGELQLAVLQHLWRLGRGTVYDVLDGFPEEERPRYTTVLTVLRGLEEKGLVEHTERDRAYVFRPTTDVAQVRRRVVSDLLNRVFGGSPQELVAALMQVEGITPKVAAELKALVEAKEASDGDA